MSRKKLTRPNRGASVRLRVGNGFGSNAGCKIRRFASLTSQKGSGLKYTDDATNGAYITVTRRGMLFASYTDVNYVAASKHGITINITASDTTVSITAIAATAPSQVLANANDAAGGAFVAATGFMLAEPGTRIYPHTDGTTNGSTTGLVTVFTVTLAPLE